LEAAAARFEDEAEFEAEAGIPATPADTSGRKRAVVWVA